MAVVQWNTESHAGFSLEFTQADGQGHFDALTLARNAILAEVESAGYKTDRIRWLGIGGDKSVAICVVPIVKPKAE